jgi:hypothetical protein
LVLYAQVAMRMACGQKPIDIEQHLLVKAAARARPGLATLPVA